MSKLTVKQLAEEFLYCDRVLTEKEKQMIESSKYKSILGETASRFSGAFDKLVEEIVDKLDAPEEVVQKFKSSRDYSKTAHLDILRNIEEEFDLDLVKNLYPDYDKIDAGKFKQVIKDYLEDHQVSNAIKNFYSDLLKLDDLAKIHTEILNAQRLVK
jgi:hypothetical protein